MLDVISLQRRQLCATRQIKTQANHALDPNVRWKRSSIDRRSEKLRHLIHEVLYKPHSSRIQLTVFVRFLCDEMINGCKSIDRNTEQ